MTFKATAIDALGEYHGNAFFTCPACRRPLALAFNSGTPVARGGSIPTVKAALLTGSWSRTLSEAGYTVSNVWPRLEQTAAPDAVPASVSRNFIQADEARKRDHREAAGMAYRRALELALKDRGPELSGPLQKRIDKLAATGKLTPDLATWAHSVRLLGNEATHDEPEPSEEDIDDLGAFTRVVLEYLYTMPAKVKKRTANAVPVASDVDNDTQILSDAEEMISGE
jgi:hypothetical protein